MHVSKLIDKEVCKLYKIDVSSLMTGAILGSAVLYDVKLYQSKKEFIADQRKHFAAATYSDHKYGFLIGDSKRFDKSIPLKGQLGFFIEVSDNRFRNPNFGIIPTTYVEEYNSLIQL
jgi:hypothetical protein